MQTDMLLVLLSWVVCINRCKLLKACCLLSAGMVPLSAVSGGSGCS